MAEEDVRAKRQRIQRQLLSKGSCTRTALVDCLTMLSAEGLLTAELGATSKRTLRREVQTAVEQHASMNTPYGPVMQSMDLGAPALRQWEYANPFAFLHYLTSISDRFGDMMAQKRTRQNHATTTHHLYRRGEPGKSPEARQRSIHASDLLVLCGLAPVGVAACISVDPVRRAAIQSDDRSSWWR